MNSENIQQGIKHREKVSLDTKKNINGYVKIISVEY